MSRGALALTRERASHGCILAASARRKMTHPVPPMVNGALRHHLHLYRSSGTFRVADDWEPTGPRLLPNGDAAMSSPKSI